MPVFYIPHGGGPWPFMNLPPHLDHGPNLRPFLENIRNTLPRQPKSILVISAHWEQKFPTLLDPRDSRHSLLFDYHGFPPETYEIEYPAPTAPQVTDKISSLLTKAGFGNVSRETNRGIDHGVFVPLKLMFPHANIPVAQLSLLADMDPDEHIRLGTAIAPLRDDDVLIVGSGMSYHNLRNLMSGIDVEETSDVFDSWLADSVTSDDPNEMKKRLTQWTSAPNAREAHPREEHLLPLMVCAGAAGSDRGSVSFSDRIMGAKVMAVEFGGRQEEEEEEDQC